MNRIEIRTAQNVVIEYELAGLRDRIFAFLIDFIIICGSIFIASICIDLFNLNSNYIIWGFHLPVFLFYSLISDIWTDGQSIGKKTLKIKVTRIDGAEVTLSDYFIRWAFRLLDIYFSLGALACLLINSSDTKQRLGDFLSNTTVIRMQPKANLAMKDLLNIKSLGNYEPVYRNVIQFSEKDMMFIKSTMDLAIKYPNDAHKEAISTLVQKIMVKLEIKETPDNKGVFLKTVINDYIALTR